MTKTVSKTNVAGNIQRLSTRLCFFPDIVSFLYLVRWEGVIFFKSPTDLFIYPFKQLTCKKSSESDKEHSMPTKGIFDDRSNENRYDGAHDLKHRDQTGQVSAGPVHGAWWGQPSGPTPRQKQIEQKEGEDGIATTLRYTM